MHSGEFCTIGLPKRMRNEISFVFTIRITINKINNSTWANTNRTWQNNVDGQRQAVTEGNEMGLGMHKKQAPNDSSRWRTARDKWTAKWCDATSSRKWNGRRKKEMKTRKRWTDETKTKTKWDETKSIKNLATKFSMGKKCRDKLANATDVH